MGSPDRRRDPSWRGPDRTRERDGSPSGWPWRPLCHRPPDRRLWATRWRPLAAADRSARIAVARSCSLQRMERLTNAHEMLDGPLDEPATLEGNLRDLH